ncbi:helix-turn-helix domain-containing protein [Azospirillum halopraeferens]|uniref:helix-turn-helix domain-containing protein n=1 Tax=Azospirillum halopraeferens TaxID=34010 RepID=UPI000687BC20|nr:helix-turn-helix domain-containing protein [Azospirillum halopraeferens]
MVLRLCGEVQHPVTLIQTLASWGPGLRKSHEIVTRLVAGERVPVLLANAPEPVEVISTLARLGVAVNVPHPPAAVDVKAIRAKLGLSQKEFAARFCFDVGSVQNWEQGRYIPDPPTRILLKVIEQHPEAVEDVLG